MRRSIEMKAKATGLVLALVFAAGVAWGQPEVEWERTYSFDAGAFFYGEQMLQTADGGFFLNGRKEEGLWIMRTDEVGDSLWTHERDSMICTNMVHAEDDFVLAGFTEFGLNSDVKLWKINEHGGVIWSNVYPTDLQERWPYVSNTEDGGFVILANYYTGPPKSWLIRTDSNGDTLWSKLYERSYSDVIETSSGGFALISGLWLMLTDRHGNEVASKEFQSDDIHQSHKTLIETLDGGFAIAGNCFSMEDYEDNDFYILRTDSAGDSLWYRRFGDNHDERPYSIIECEDGGFTLGGYTDYGFGKFWLLRLDANGEELWSMMYPDNDTSSFMTTLIRSEDNSYFVFGHYYIDVETYNPFIIKTTPDPVSVRDPRSTLNPLTFNLYPAYPNPFNSSVTIPFGLDKSTPTRLAIFDPLGRRVADLTGRFGDRPYAGNHSVVWNANGMPAGQYIIRLEAGNQQLSQRLSLVK